MFDRTKLEMRRIEALALVAIRYTDVDFILDCNVIAIV